MDFNSSNFNLDCNIRQTQITLDEDIQQEPLNLTIKKLETKTKNANATTTRATTLLTNPTTSSSSTDDSRAEENSIEQLAAVIINDQPMLEIEIESSSSSPPSSTASSTNSLTSTSTQPSATSTSGRLMTNLQKSSSSSNTSPKKSVLFDTVTVYHFTRSQGFSSIPSQGGSTLGMKRRHFLRRKLSVDLFEEVRRRSRREILLKIKYDKHRTQRNNSPINIMTTTATTQSDSISNNSDNQLIDSTHHAPAAIHDNEDHHMATPSASVPQDNDNVKKELADDNISQPSHDRDDVNQDQQMHCPPSSSLASSSSTTESPTSGSTSDDSFSDCSDISDSELEGESCIFLQPLGVKLRRSLLRASGVSKIDPTEKLDCRIIRESRERSGCRCVNQCIPGICECTLLGVNCQVDRVSFPCGCISAGCRNPLGRTEFDVKRVKGHLYETLFKIGIG